MNDEQRPDRRADVLRRFERARGVPDDRRWAERAAGRLLLEQADPDQTDHALAAAAEAIETDREAPDALLGSPDEWARAQQARWRQEGAPLVRARDVPGLHDSVGSWLFGTAWFALLFGAFSLVTGDWRVSPVTLGAIPLLAAGVVLVPAAYRRVLRRVSFLAAVIATAAAIAAFSVLVGWGIATVQRTGPAPVAVGWLLLLAFAAAAVGAAWTIWMPRRRRRPVADARITDDAWARSFAAALRDRGDLTDGRVAELVDEARSHAAESGAPLIDEFGPAGPAARRYARTTVVRARRRTLFWAVVCAFPLLRLVDFVAEQGWSLTWESGLLAVWLASAGLCLVASASRWLGPASRGPSV